MRLTKEQLEQFDREGFLFFPGQFTPEETRALTQAVPELYSRREAYNVREKGSDAVRTNFAGHMVSEPFARFMLLCSTCVFSISCSPPQRIGTM